MVCNMDFGYHMTYVLCFPGFKGFSAVQGCNILKPFWSSLATQCFCLYLLSHIQTYKPKFQLILSKNTNIILRYLVKNMLKALDVVHGIPYIWCPLLGSGVAAMTVTNDPMATTLKVGSRNR